MRRIAQLLLLIVLSGASLFFLPWYTFAIVIFLAALFLKTGKAMGSFLTGFFAAGLSWLVLYLWQDRLNESILSTRMAELFTLSSPTTLFLVLSLLAAIIGGLAALAGYQLKKIF